MFRQTAFVIGVTLALIVSVGCKKQEQPASSTTARTTEVKAVAGKVAEAGCALCIYKMKQAKGCELAVKIDGATYLVDGKKMDDLGDAHAPDGMCNVARQARLDGRIEGDRFVAQKVELLPGEPTGGG